MQNQLQFRASIERLYSIFLRFSLLARSVSVSASCNLCFSHFQSGICTLIMLQPSSDSALWVCLLLCALLYLLANDSDCEKCVDLSLPTRAERETSSHCWADSLDFDLNKCLLLGFDFAAVRLSQPPMPPGPLSPTVLSQRPALCRPLAGGVVKNFHVICQCKNIFCFCHHVYVVVVVIIGTLAACHVFSLFCFICFHRLPTWGRARGRPMVSAFWSLLFLLCKLFCQHYVVFAKQLEACQ